MSPPQTPLTEEEHPRTAEEQARIAEKVEREELLRPFIKLREKVLKVILKMRGCRSKSNAANR